VDNTKPKAPHTPGPWRWEISMNSKRLHLVGGKPMYDLSIMDFDRWGMSSAVVTLRDTAHDGMNIMHRLPDRPDWIAPFPGREHHASWCQDITHPDMRLMAAAPDLLDALIVLVEKNADYMRRNNLGDPEREDATKQARAAIAKATA
jgi:hypothetical protein